MRIVFMGTPRAAVPTLERLLRDGHEVAAVWTQPDKPAGRGNRLTPPPVKDFALENGLPVFQPEKIRTPESLRLFQSHAAEVAVVVAYGRILPETFLRAFPKGAVNVHFSLLPKYRGAAPVNWAVVRGETMTGVTTMRMDAGLDTGDILLQRETEISPEENAIELTERLAIAGADLLSETLRVYDAIRPRKQDDSRATLAPILQKSDGLIDWRLTAEEINNRVRGFQPFPTSFTSLQGKKLTVWKAHPAAAEKGDPGAAAEEAAAGKVLNARGGRLVVSCGARTALEILELQAEGKRRMSARDFLNGAKIEIGERLGETG